MHHIDKSGSFDTANPAPARESNPHTGKPSPGFEENIAPAETPVLHEDAIALIRKNLISARESAIELREGSASPHEGSATLREELATLREESASLRKLDILAAGKAQESTKDYIARLQQVNERLINATIEAQKLADDLLLAKDQLEHAKNIAEKASLAKTEFLSNMSHELRTPLNAILGFSQLLESGNPSPSSSQMARLNEITKAGWYLLELINTLLDLAVIESGKLSLSQKPVPVCEVISQCMTMIETQAQNRNIQVKLHPFDPAYIVNADKTRLKQVLLNLLSNAIKYNHELGAVEVECVLTTTQCIRINIKDSGPGLPPEKQAQLFQPFNRLGQENNGEQGTGIGLVVSKQLVELMGGTIGVESKPGEGSTFWIELMQSISPKPAASKNLLSVPPVNMENNAERRTLLYIEDNPANLMLVEQIIREYPQICLFSAAEDGISIALAYADLLDVILMDINMPGISGLKALDILRKNPATANIPVIALSANAMPHDIHNGLEAGFFRYITKPIKINEFKHVLLDALIFSAKSRLKTKKPDTYNDYQ